MYFGLGHMGAGFGRLGSASSKRGVARPAIKLSASTIPEDAAVNDAIGTLSVTNLGALTVSSYAITADPDSKFIIGGVGSDELLVNAALDFETDPSHSVTLEATFSDASTVERTFTITVTDVSEGGAFAGAGQFYQLLFAA